MQHSLHSFTFFIKERSVLCVLLHSLKRNAAFFAFFYFLYKRTLRSFWFHKSYKNDRISQKKECKRTARSFLRLKKNLLFFLQYIFIYIYIFIYLYMYIQYLYICIYIYIYIYWKKKCNILLSFAKEWNVLAFFYVLCKRPKRSLRSFTLFTKERCVLCVLLRF